MKTFIAIAALIAVAVGQDEDDCYSADDEAACLAISGCLFESSDMGSCGYRGGNPCDGQNDEGSCTAAAGGDTCVWSETFCYRDEDACEELMDADECNANQLCNYETESNGFCTEDRVECYNFRNATSCNGARDTGGAQACMFSTSEYANCEAFNGCTRLDAQGDCNGADGCAWTENAGLDDDITEDGAGGFCGYEEEDNEAGMQSCYADDSGNEYTQQSCTQGDRAGSNRRESCQWTVIAETFCQAYSPCPAAEGRSACSALGSDCQWDEDSEECAPNFDDIDTGGSGGGSGFSDGSGGLGSGSGGSFSDGCFGLESESECVAERDDAGEAACSFVSTSSISCEPITPCTYGSATNCSGIDGCGWAEFDGVGTCSTDGAAEDDEASNEDCYMADDSTACAALRNDDGSPACRAREQESAFCSEFSPCYAFSVTEGLCTQRGAAFNCTWQADSNQCAPDFDNDFMGSGDGGISDSGECWSANNASDCVSRPREEDDSSENPRCTYVTTADSYCEAFDPCTVFTRQPACNAQAGCSWPENDVDLGGDVVGEVSCASDGTGTTPAGTEEIDCGVFIEAATCRSAGGGTPQRCVFQTYSSAYCTDWGPCIGAPSQSADACDAADGCWWEQWGVNRQDGACSEGERPPSTTQSPTDSPSPPPPPTYFSCPNPDTEFQCETIDRCINIDWTCDGISDCSDGSDEAYSVCPTESVITVTETPGECRSYQYPCANRECIQDWARTARCDGVVQCADESDETGCPTSAPTLASAAPTVPPPTPSPVPSPTPAPTPTPVCLSRCDSNIATLRRIESSASYSDPPDCRACLGGFADIASFCATAPVPDSSTCVTLRANSNTDPLVVYFRVPASSTQSEMATNIQAAFENEANIDQSTWSGEATLAGPDGDGVYSASYPIASKASYDTCVARLENSRSPMIVSVAPGEPLVVLHATAAGAAASSPAGGGSSTGNANAKDDDEDDQSTMLIISVIFFVLVFALLAFVVIKKFLGGSSSMTPRGPSSTYQNPEFAPQNGSTAKRPDWADPNVPFLSRPEAEKQLQGRGLQNGDYVVRQTTSTVNGYVITAVNRGVFSNSQLKYANGALNYGGMAIGGDLEEALVTLQTKIKIAPQNGEAYYLTAGSTYLDVEADA